MENLVLGAMWFGTRTDEDTSFELLDRFVDAGGVWIDTSNSYAFWVHPSGFGGQSETVIGRWLARRPGMRDRVRISTKVGAEPASVGTWPSTAEGLSAGVIKGALESSLSRLGTDRVELYWAHMPDAATPLEETVGAFDSLFSDGLVGRYGCSNYPVWQVERARQISRERGGAGFTAIQQHHTYLRPRPGVRPSGLRFGGVTDEVLDYVEHHSEMVLWAYTPLLSGSYVRADKPLAETYSHPGTDRRLAVLDSVAGEIGVDRNAVVLAWLTGAGVVPVVGVSSGEQLDAAVAGVSLELSGEQRDRLDAAV
jgi:aryl-alcohol dehydrogenase-like predicted oxidoreductase